MDIQALVSAQRTFFQTGSTLSLSARRSALNRLRQAVTAREGEIAAALRSDLGKSPAESWMCETGLILSELRYVERRLAAWMRDRSCPAAPAQLPGRGRIAAEPYGTALILAPWNYPFLLTLQPLIGAIAAGNCCVVKPSPDASASSKLLRALLAECFPPEFVAAAEGGLEVSQALLEQKFDVIFFTGGPAAGREVMAKAAERLTPVILELGGKSPCVVDATANLDLAAKRVAFGKLLNGGQTCVAPDYLLIDRRVKDRFLVYLRRWMAVMRGTGSLDGQGCVRMVNRRHFDRVMGLIDPSKVVFGGKGEPDTLRIQPTVLDSVSPEDPVMQEEIFGPVLPVLSVQSLPDAAAFVRARPRPLALYLFSRDRNARELFLRQVSFGGGCVNDTVLHLASSRMPFGGVGESGMGAYHGKASFDAFSHYKSVLTVSSRLDLPVRYPPYTPVKRGLLRLLLR